MTDTDQPVILIIDDSMFVLQRMQELVAEMPDIAAVHIASNAEHAMDLIKQYSPVIVILEMHFGGSAGRQIFQFIKASYPFVKIIIATNKATSDYRQRSLESGAHGFIDKTTEFENIPSLIRSFSF